MELQVIAEMKGGIKPDIPTITHVHCTRYPIHKTEKPSCKVLDADIHRGTPYPWSKQQERNAAIVITIIIVTVTIIILILFVIVKQQYALWGVM